MHPRYLKRAGETDERLFSVAAWRVRDRSDPVPDAIWDEATRHYDEPPLAALIIAIATINAWNRLNVATRQVAVGEKGF